MIPAAELGTPRTIEEYNEAVGRVRKESALRRTRAWACVPETVLGIELSPITPARYTALVATNNAFIFGRLPMEHDLRNFIWFCSPQFNPDAPMLSTRWKPLQMFRLNNALTKRPRKQPKDEAVFQHFAQAIVEIRAIIELTFSDGLPASDGNHKPVAASMEAQLVDMFAREYAQWPLPQPMRHTPIKQLYQLARCIDRNYGGSKAVYHDPAEAALDRAFLAVINQSN